MKRTSIITPVRGLVGLFFLFMAFTACQKEYSVQTGASLAARGSLYDSTGNCMSDSVVGAFYDGIAPNGTLAQSADTAYVLAKVNVTTAGTYNITSNIQNGIYFSDSGYFTSTGINTIKLYPVGTPIIPGTYSYSITFDSSTCFFSVITQDSTGTGLGAGGGTPTNPNLSDTAWKFTGPAGSYHGIIDTAFEKDSSNGFHYLLLAGNTTGDSVFYAVVAFSGGAISPGSYSTASAALFTFTDLAGNPIYTAYPGMTGTPVAVVITITSYNAATKIVTATFTGTAQNATGQSVNITSGSFTVKVT